MIINIKEEEVMKKNAMIFTTIAMSALIALTGCSASPVVEKTEAPAKEKSVNLYTDRHYESDDVLYKMFTDQTGIKVNVVKGKPDELIERLKTEGTDSEADLLVLADAGKLHQAKVAELLQNTSSETLNTNIPEKFRDRDGQWYGITKRARVIIYSKERVNPSELSTYADLTDTRWEKRILIRSSENVYNQSLLASFIELDGKDSAKSWAAGIVKNMARDPEGGDRDQAKAIAAGLGDVAVMNTYYFGQMLNSSDVEEKKVAEALGVFFPDQNGAGTHVNISGIGLTKVSKNTAEAIALMEYLSGVEAQKLYAETNYEYPVNPEVEPSELLKSWGAFKEQEIPLNVLGDLNVDAVQLFGEVGWK